MRSNSWVESCFTLQNAVNVRAKPDDLPSAIELDIGPLDSFEAVLHASDLQMPAGVTLVTDPSEPILRVQQPRTEEPTIVAAEEGEEAAAATEGGAEGGAESEGEAEEGS